MADNETIADIIAEMRGMGNYQRYSGDHARVLANRLEAALKRERAKIEADALEVGGIVEAAHKSEMSKNVSKKGADFGQLGDCAKLREALAPFPSLCEWLVENAAKLGIPDMVAKLRERGDKARAALAAPPRNCDKYENAKDAWFAFDALQSKKGAKWHWTEYADWLFAPATEEEGGAK